MTNNQVDRLRAALAMRGPAHAGLAGRVRSEHLPGALVELARELVGEEGWRFVVGRADAKPRRTARK